ncbi:hypothetical protein ACN4EK_30425 [Pantanalinema rosaneae CENA516]|uniref:hypothetical protein n=1 Tax=Pantanalinema rosaneae TaxID=1620701 RepID=UPI003D6E0762
MNARIVAGLTILAISTTSLAGFAQTTANLPDVQGDYYRNDTPVQGTAPRPLMAGSLWQVVATELPCRQEPGTDQPIVRQYRQGEILQVEVYRGGSDEVLLNTKDGTGKPWMPVRGKRSADRCYVRANQRYIQPVTE